MDWSNESYVRVYTRDTADLLAFGWEGRYVWYELLRKADQAGVIDTGGDLEVLPELLRVPPEVFDVGFKRILKRGSAILTDTAIVIPNHVPAQTAKKSEKQRQRESRDKRRAVAIANGESEAEAKAAARPDVYGSQNVTVEVTERDQGVTRGHTRSHAVTSGHSMQCSAVHSPQSPPEGAGGVEQLALVPDQQQEPPGEIPGESSLSRRKRKLLRQHLAQVEPLWELQAELRQRALPRSRGLSRKAEYLVAIAEALARGNSPSECEHVLRVTAAEVQTGATDEHWFNGVSNWSEKPFAIRLAKPVEGSQPRRVVQGAGYARE
jgi:hypothetical protein